MNNYRIYGWHLDTLDSFDEYYQADTAKAAVAMAKREHPGYFIADVSRVLKGKWN